MKWEDWDKVADRGTSGDMVRDILTDWKKDKVVIREATLRGVGEWLNRHKPRYPTYVIRTFLRGDMPD